MNEINEIPVENITVGIGLLLSMVIGATELVRRLFDKDYKASALIVVSALVGGLAGAFLFEEIGFALGVVVGLSGSGVITGLQKFGQGTNSEPTALKRPA